VLTCPVWVDESGGRGNDLVELGFGAANRPTADLDEMGGPIFPFQPEAKYGPWHRRAQDRLKLLILVDLLII
jgi:hypothetical protein